MHLLIELLLSTATSWAENTLEITHVTPVYQTPSEGSHLLFYLQPGEEITTNPNKGNDLFYHIQVKRKGKNLVGFVDISDIAAQPEEKPTSTRWGYGVGLEYTSLDQKGK